MQIKGKTADEYLNEAKSAYDGAIPFDVMDTYEVLKAKEDGKESPKRKLIKQQVEEYLRMSGQATDAAESWIRLGNLDFAKRLCVHAQEMASNAENLLIQLNDVE